VRGFDGVEALVPNSSFLENQVVNWTYSDARIRREIRIGIAYGSPVRWRGRYHCRLRRRSRTGLEGPEAGSLFRGLRRQCAAAGAVFWVELGPKLFGRRVDSDLRYAMEKRLGAAGIRIPFPQHDVHLDASQPLPVRITPAPPATD
jgi:potassium efflux system protein